MVASMTPSQQAKAAGLTGLRQVSKISGVSEQTLNNWHRDKPKQFEITLLGCISKIEQNHEGMPQLTPENLDNAKAQILSAIEEDGCLVKRTHYDSGIRAGLERALEIIEECQTVETE